MWPRQRTKRREAGALPRVRREGPSGTVDISRGSTYDWPTGAGLRRGYLNEPRYVLAGEESI
jgi:hypothetical protein